MRLIMHIVKLQTSSTVIHGCLDPEAVIFIFFINPVSTVMRVLT